MLNMYMAYEYVAAASPIALPIAMTLLLSCKRENFIQLMGEHSDTFCFRSFLKWQRHSIFGSSISLVRDPKFRAVKGTGFVISRLNDNFIYTFVIDQMVHIALQPRTVRNEIDIVESNC